MNPERGQIWKNKRTGREARILHTREYPVGHFALDFRYRTPNPNSHAKRMTRNRRMTVPMNVKSFLEKFEFVSDGKDSV